MSEAEEMRVTGDDQETAMREYREAGEARARALGNRGPIRFSADGSLHDDILAAYWQHGFYIFESVITQNERADMERDVQEIIERAPTEPGGVVDRHGRAALAADGKGGGVQLVKPLSDPLGGTDKNNGRHPAKMFEPNVPEDAPAYVLQVIGGSLQFSDAALRLYAQLFG